MRHFAEGRSEILGLEARVAGKRWLTLPAENRNRRIRFDIGKLIKGFEMSDAEVRALDRALTFIKIERENDAFLDLGEAKILGDVEVAIFDCSLDFVVLDPLNTFTSGGLNSGPGWPSRALGDHRGGQEGQLGAGAVRGPPLADTPAFNPPSPTRPTACSPSRSAWMNPAPPRSTRTGTCRCRSLFGNDDDALLRPVQRPVEFRLPDASMRRELLALHLPTPSG